MKTVFVTGATSGVGLEITKMCIAKGYTVYATGRNESALKTLNQLGAQVLQADLRQKEDIDRVVAWLPAIDVAVLNAGLGIFANSFDLMEEDIDNMFETNVRAPIYLTNRLVPQMQERQSGHIIYISSQAGKVATRKASVYASTKHAITGYANGVRLELAQDNIKVTAVYPGPIDTPFLDKADASNVYRDAVSAFLTQPTKVANSVIRAIEKPVREINIPGIMNVTAKLYALAPGLVETLGKGFFNKK